MMRRLVATTLMALLAGAVVLAAPASAGAPRAVSPDDCETLGTLSDNIDDSGANPTIFGKQAATVADGFQTTAGDVDDRKLRKSLRGLAAVYDDLSDADNVVGAVTVMARQARRYTKSLKVFVTASLNCATQQVTIPSLPTGITLPSGITIPSIPSIPSIPR